MEFLPKTAYIDYYSIRRNQPEIHLFHNKYYNEEAPAYQFSQNTLNFWVEPKITKKGEFYLIEAKFNLLHRIRQLQHRKADLADVDVPLFTRVYSNLIKPSIVANMDWDDGCLFGFWQEGYIGSMILGENSFSQIKIIVPNSDFKEFAELSTLISVAFGMILINLH